MKTRLPLLSLALLTVMNVSGATSFAGDAKVPVGGFRFGKHVQHGHVGQRFKHGFHVVPPKFHRGFIGGPHYSAADLIRAKGDFLVANSEANVRNAIAAQEQEVAKSQQLDNARKKLDFIADRDEFQRQYREQSVAEGRRNAEVYRAALRLKQERDQPIDIFDVPVPEALRSPELSGLVERVRRLMLVPNDQVADLEARVEEVRSIVSEVRFALRDAVRELPPADYIAAKNYLRDLERHLSAKSHDIATDAIASN